MSNSDLLFLDYTLKKLWKFTPITSAIQLRAALVLNLFYFENNKSENFSLIKTASSEHSRDHFAFPNLSTLASITSQAKVNHHREHLLPSSHHSTQRHNFWTRAIPDSYCFLSLATRLELQTTKPINHVFTLGRCYPDDVPRVEVVTEELAATFHHTSSLLPTDVLHYTNHS